MKKILLFTAIICAVCVLTGCGEPSVKPSEEPSTEPSINRPDYNPPVLPASVGENPFAGRTWQSYEPWSFTGNMIEMPHFSYRYTYDSTNKVLYFALYKSNGFTAEEYWERTPEEWASYYHMTIEEFEEFIVRWGCSGNSLEEKVKGFVKDWYLSSYEVLYTVPYYFDGDGLHIRDITFDGVKTVNACVLDYRCDVNGGQTLSFYKFSNQYVCWIGDNEYRLVSCSNNSFEGDGFSGTFTNPVLSNYGSSATISVTFTELPDEVTSLVCGIPYNLTWPGRFWFEGAEVL